MPSSFDLFANLTVQAGPWLLVLSRTLGLSWSAPALSTPGLDARSRLILAGMLAILISPLVVGDILPPATPLSLGVACLVEVIIGAGLGWSAALVIAGARQAGEVVGAQAGLSPAALFDPEAGDGLTALGHLYGLVALGVFLALDGPTQLVIGLAESYRVVPAGGVSASSDLASWAFGRIGLALVLALRLSAPIALGLTIAGLALGLLGRASPSLQLVSLSLPARTLVGLVLAALGLITLASTIGAAWQSGFPWGG
ncbi:flagellar biosynthetic protein FliR [Tundrisphaera lichenicola]|uniref:flagellar biosynthetic protein FliR n=1 Tax=Tundrisphaera lichenicola TaxID=2029860 RepID=UPI003EBA4512